MPQQSLDSFISQLLTKYQYPDRVKRDVLNSLNYYKNLNPKLETFVFNDGVRKELMCLDGTIPVPFKGVTYNIPISVWLLDTHPFNSPMCYVKPTPDMEIKVSRHVDSSGRIYLPYLHEWNPSSSDMLGLIQVMIIVFGETPPVYAKPKHQENNPYQTPYPNQSPAYQAPSSVAGVQSAYPPYANTAGSNPYPPTNYNNYPGYQPTGMAPRPAVYPAGSCQAGGQVYPPYPPSGSSYNCSGSTPYPAFPQPLNSSPLGSSQPPTSQPNPVTNMGTITDEHIRLSLLSAVEDKLKKRIKEVVAQSQAEMEVLKKTQEDLNTGKSKLDEMIIRLDREQVELQSNIQTLQDRNEEMQDLLTKMAGQGSVDIDESVVTTAPLYKQLLNAFAEESATEDAIYYIGEALRKGVIDLDVFLKNVRELSRKQFELRALMQKCRLKAGLPY